MMIIKRKNRNGRKLNTAQIITLGFAGVIFVGGLILWLPFCAAPGMKTSFSDAMFTAATCVCVTGLTTVTTAVHWSAVGKVVILFLIQIGGIGVVSLASLFFIGLHKKMSIRSRRLIQESYNLDQMEGAVRLVRRVALCIIGAESIGAVFYAICFIPEFGPQKGIIQAVFTAVSAFCNAGVDILGNSSLAEYVSSPLVNVTTILLIVASGLGFTVWWDIARNIKKVLKRQLTLRRFYKCLHLHSKIVLDMTAFLVIAGTVLIFLFERKNPASMGGLSVGGKWLASAFQSVTTRTAGFYTIDQAALTGGSTLLCLFLMFIGGSPMGTAGGVKTTTIAVLALAVVSAVRGRRDVEIHDRRIRNSYLRSAISIVGLGIMTLLTASLLLCLAMPGTALEDILYEITSALATVGLSRGLTPQLSLAGKWIVIVCMFLGRIGPITLGTAVVARANQQTENTHLAEGDIMIG